jgi:hypothetical protein
MSKIIKESQLLKAKNCSIDNKIVSIGKKIEAFVSRDEKGLFPLYSINFGNYYEIKDIRNSSLINLIIAISKKLPIKIEIGKNMEYRIPHVIDSTIKRIGPILIYKDGNWLKTDSKDEIKNIWKPELYLEFDKEKELDKFAILLKKIYRSENYR